MSQERSIYFDHNATTPLDPRVLEAMLPWFGDDHGNPSSAHAGGRRARRAVDDARQKIADLLGGQPSEIVFVSSGSEANNMVIRTAARRGGEGGHIVTSILEHPSVRASAARWFGDSQTSELTPKADGCVSVAEVGATLREDTRLVCLMLANNELGTLQPVSEVAEICRERGIPVLSDSVQAIGKIPVDVDELNVDYLVLGGHKFHGPPGIAALWVRTDAPLEPLLVGASQEASRRAGTENVPAIVGLGEAAALARAEVDARHRHLLGLRRQLEEGLASLPGTVVHCDDSERLPHTCHVAFLGASGHQLMLHLDRLGISVSTGSACHSGRPQPSAALLAMGLPESEALASLRISLGFTNTRDEITRFLAVLPQVLSELPEPATVNA